MEDDERRREYFSLFVFKVRGSPAKAGADEPRIGDVRLRFRVQATLLGTGARRIRGFCRVGGLTGTVTGI